jgi:HAE1 family hydrophobic/amphiphilic exporter-1
LVVEITGKDLQTLSELAEAVRDRLVMIEDLKNVEMNIRQGRPEINIVIDRTVAAQFSLDASQIGQELTNMLSGAEAGRMTHQGEYVDIMMRRPDVSLDELEGVLFESSSGRMVRLDEVARLETDYAPREIVRANQSRVALISAHIASERSFDKIVADVRQALSDLTLPAEYSTNITGEEKLREEEFGSLKFALLLAIILVYMVMAAQFESFLHPFVILLTIPLAGVGTVFLMLIMGTPFNIMSYIGAIMLAGIAVNDSIILVDRINRNRRQGDQIDDAIVSAGQTRIRPIIMTSITTVLALLPLTIGFGEGASLRSPMALAVIGGLFTSTALTLIVIPAVYRIIAGRFKIGGTGEPGPV